MTLDSRWRTDTHSISIPTQTKMSKIFSRSPDSVQERVVQLIKKYHPELHAIELKVDCISVVSSEAGESALKLHGYPCAAIVKIVSSKDRSVGRGDAEIVIDEASYSGMKEEEKDALIDHELTHLQVKRNRYGLVKMDEHNRPKLKMKLHDREYGWFDAIAERHGLASLECKQSTQLFLSGKQTYFEFSLSGKLGDGVEAKVKLLPRRK